MNDNENKIEQEQNQKDRTRYAKGLSLIQIMFLLAVDDSWLMIAYSGQLHLY